MASTRGKACKRCRWAGHKGVVEASLRPTSAAALGGIAAGDDLGATTGTTGAAGSSGTTTAPAPPLPRRLGVDEVEYRVTASRTVLGADQHDLAIARNGVLGVQTPLIDSKGAVTVTADLSPGTYRLYCTLFGGQHDAWGMNTTITVQ